jgi:hypothetical protein
LTEIKGLYNVIQPTIGLIPEAISTDCDQALRNALLAIFPESPALLCMWHANKNVQQHCKAKFTSAEAYNEFFQAWTSIVQSPDIPEYKSRLDQFLTTYSCTSEHLECVQYIQSTWLRPSRKEALVLAWTKQYTHFGVIVTSRLVIYYSFLDYINII